VVAAPDRAARRALPGAAIDQQLARLGRLQATWAARKQDNCEAGHSGRLAPDLRRAREACLDQRMAQLRASAVQAGEASGVDEAVYLLAEVPTTDGCDDSTLTMVTAPAPEQAAAVLRERQALAVVAGLEVAGQYAAALHSLGPIERAAEALGHAPLLAEVLYQRARLEHYRGDLQRARETLAQAIDHAEAHRHDRLAADAWGFLVEIAALARTPGERHTLEAWHRRARAARARLHGDRNDRADRLAIFLDEHGWTPWRTPRAGDPQQVHPLLMQGLVHLREGDAARAARSFDDALTDADLHPRTRAKLLLNRAVAIQEQVGEDAAMRAWDEAVAAFAAATWPGHRRTRRRGCAAASSCNGRAASRRRGSTSRRRCRPWPTSRVTRGRCARPTPAWRSPT
jgi:tetratricopeptide (TPR) repeat protein